MNSQVQRKLVGSGLNFLTLALAVLIFFPIFWMVLTSFKHEVDAFTSPPQILFQPTLDNWQNALQDSSYFGYLTNSLVITIFSTLCAVLLGLPAAYTLAFHPGPRTNFTLMWLMSTRMLPAVGVILPLYIIFKNLGLFDSHLGLILIFTGANLPLVIWMMHSFLADLPYEVIEAARVDGTTLLQEFQHVILPLAIPGLMAAMLLCFIFSWNEFFVAFNLTITKAAPLTVYIVGFKTSEGLYWAKMSAAATLAVAPVIIAGWVAQRYLVRGLTAGAIK